SCALGLCALPVAQVLAFQENSPTLLARKGFIKPRRSPYFTALAGGEARCELCPRQCRVPKGQRGFCRVRENRDGQIYSLAHGNPCAVHLDPIERKPFFHVLPGTRSLSLATTGCNLHCKFCESWEFSQALPEEVFNYDMPPEAVVEKAKSMAARSIAYSFVEPTVFHEYALDTAALARKAGLLNVFHSNGFINPRPLRDLAQWMDAANIDLKGFTETFYRDLCDGQLAPVLETLKALKRQKLHLEITHLVIPGRNDDLPTVKEMCLWVKRELGADTPLHFVRFYPLYKLQGLPPTPVPVLESIRATALSAGLEHVYIANVPGHEAGNTFCPGCKKKVIQRTGFMIGETHLKEGRCGHCGKPLPGLWA
ncbi:MAG: AmmeMemoRadiSam system radical SAM enzyme, partial [Planctomycetes bacterium]|nr:AmmeMemoRadiSam system radical SAM enzyme [Planctomycetota bacterium]